MTKAKPKTKAKPADMLDAFVASDPTRVLQLVFWKTRHQNPEMTVLIREEDLNAFDQCMAYQKVNPGILVYRPEGKPATQGTPAVGTRRAIPASPAEPPRPFVVVGLVERGTRNAVKPVENNEADFNRGELARELQVARRNIPTLAAELRRTAASGDFSSATLEDAARTLELLGRP